MAFGQIDYRSLDRSTQGIAQFGENQMRNDETRIQVQQDQADRANAEATSGQFAKDIEDALPKEGKAPNYDVMFRAAAKAGEGFAKTGGRHSQAGALRIHQMLDDLVKIHPPQSRAVKPELRDVLGPDGLPEVKTVDGVKFKHRQMFHPESGATMGENWEKVQGEFAPARASGGGRGGAANQTIGSITERTQTGELRLKRDKVGKPVKLTQPQHAALLEKLTNAKNQRDIKRDALERQAVEAEDDAATTEALLNQPGMENDEFTKGLVKERKNKAATIRSQVNDLEKQGKDDETLLKDVQEYDPEKTDAEKPAPAKPVITHKYIVGKGAVPVGEK